MTIALTYLLLAGGTALGILIASLCAIAGQADLEEDLEHALADLEAARGAARRLDRMVTR